MDNYKLMKKCIKCNEEKELTEFRIDKKCRDGYRTDCKICEINRQKQYRLNNKEKIKKYQKEYVKKHNLNNKEYNKEYYKNNKEKINKYQKEYRLKVPNYQKEYQKKRKLIDPMYKLRCNIGSLISKSITRQGYKKTSKSQKIIGCTFIELKNYLEIKFTEGMNWENYGKWHIDHIYPVSLATDEKHLIQLNHYTNFQPLWAIDNIKKGNKII